MVEGYLIFGLAKSDQNSPRLEHMHIL